MISNIFWHRLPVCRSNANIHLNQVLQSGQQPSEDQQEMRSILSETLLTVKAELDSLPQPASRCDGLQVDQEVTGEGGKALALLEQYAELLLKSVERRLDTKTWGDGPMLATRLYAPTLAGTRSTVNCTIVICTKILRFTGWMQIVFRDDEGKGLLSFMHWEKNDWRVCLIFQAATALLCLFFLLFKNLNFINTSSESPLLRRETPEGQKNDEVTGGAQVVRRVESPQKIN